jgi:hypothetical protein
MTSKKIADGSNTTALRAEAAFVRMLDACMKVSAKASRLSSIIDDGDFLASMQGPQPAPKEL